uniref:OSJNBa0028M15.10 protein n=1 Tax=Oryza sativa subsp. japonica TaxID=39947 RepID=Q7XK77_ORYSJ|nr:OSJNBa0028M15.10 [Oryza sativa Japonica Group]
MPLLCNQPHCALVETREKKDGGYEASVKNGWNGFHRKERLKLHVGDVGGSHYQAMKKCDDLLQKRQHIDVAFHSVRETCKRDYLTRLNGSIDVARMLVKLGLPFLGYDESKESNNRGNFREFRDYTAEQNPSLRKAIERFVGLVHVTETTSAYLKSSIDALFAKLKLTLKQVRGQGYDGASNMRSEFNGLQSLIMRENSSAYYVHCFDHQLQLVPVAIVRKHKGVSDFFTKISILLNVVGGSSKRRDLIRDINVKEIKLDNHFSETSFQLLICSSAFSPRDSFHDFNLENLMSLAKLYPSDFNSGNLRDLSHQLGLYIADVRDDGRFSNIQTIAELSQIMEETRKHLCYPLVYQLLKLVLVLPVATATVERCFSAMKNVKTYLRNKIGDEYLSDSLICYVEKEEMKKVTNEAVVRRFMKMQGRRFDDDRLSNHRRGF